MKQSLLFKGFFPPVFRQENFSKVLFATLSFKFIEVPNRVPFNNRVAIFPFYGKPDMTTVGKVIGIPSVAYINESILFPCT